MAFINKSKVLSGLKEEIFSPNIGEEAVVHSLFLSNTSNEVVTVEVYLKNNSDNSEVVILKPTLKAGEFFSLSKNINLSSLDSLSIEPSRENVVTCMLSILKQGADGVSTSISLNPRGEFVDGATYNKLDIVSYLGSSYVALVNGVTTTPVAGASWGVVASSGEGAISSLFEDSMPKLSNNLDMNGFRIVNGNVPIQEQKSFTVHPTQKVTVTPDIPFKAKSLYNVNIFEEKLNLQESENSFSITGNYSTNLKGKDFSKSSDIILSAHENPKFKVATLSTDIWVTDDAGRAVYSNSGLGSFYIHEINTLDSSKATVVIVDEFNSNIIRSGEWKMYDFLVNNGEVTIGKEGAAEVIKQEFYEFSRENPKLWGRNQYAPSMFKDSDGSLHILWVGSDTVNTFNTIKYATNKSGDWVFNEDVLSSFRGEDLDFGATAGTNTNIQTARDSLGNFVIGFHMTHSIGGAGLHVIKGNFTDGFTLYANLEAKHSDVPTIAHTRFKLVVDSVGKFHILFLGVFSSNYYGYYATDSVGAEVICEKISTTVLHYSIEMQSIVVNNEDKPIVVLTSNATAPVATVYERLVSSWVVQESNIAQGSLYAIQSVYMIHDSAVNKQILLFVNMKSNSTTFDFSIREYKNDSGSFTLVRNYYYNPACANIRYAFLREGVTNIILGNINSNDLWHIDSSRSIYTSIIDEDYLTSSAYDMNSSIIENEEGELDIIFTRKNNGNKTNEFVNSIGAYGLTIAKSFTKFRGWTKTVGQQTGMNLLTGNTLSFDIDSTGTRHIACVNDKTLMYYTEDELGNRSTRLDFITMVNLTVPSKNCEFVKLFVDSNDKLHVFYTNPSNNSSYKRLIYSTNASGTWAHNTDVGQIGSSVNIHQHSGISIARGTGVNDFHIVYQDTWFLSGTSKISYCYKGNNSTSFTYTKNVSGMQAYNQYAGVVAVDSQNKAHIFWGGISASSANSYWLHYTTNKTGSFTPEYNINPYIQRVTAVYHQGAVVDSIDRPIYIGGFETEHTTGDYYNFFYKDTDGTWKLQSDVLKMISSYTTSPTMFQAEIDSDDVIHIALTRNTFNVTGTIRVQYYYGKVGEDLVNVPDVFNEALGYYGTTITALDYKTFYMSVQDNGVYIYCADVNSHIKGVFSDRDVYDYKVNTPVVFTFDNISTEYWLSLRSIVTEADSNTKTLNLMYTLDGLSWYVYKNGTTRLVVTKDTTITGGAEGIYYYNESATEEVTLVMGTSDFYDTTALALAVAENKMTANELADFNTENLEQVLNFAVMLETDDKNISPTFNNIELTYNGMSSWVEKTHEYTVSSEGVKFFTVTPRELKKTSNIKIVYTY